MAYTNIKKSSDYFNTKLYTGNGSTQSITGVGFQPDWTWIKYRNSGTYGHDLYDAVRGATKTLNTNNTNSEYTSADRLTAFASDGFNLDSNASVNENSGTYVSWNWNANGAGVANTDGTISSTVSANTTSGFSIVKWTSTDTAGSTIGHGVGSVPKMIITKKITSGNPGNWTVYHNSIGNTKSIALNTTGAEDAATSYWNDTSPTSSVFSTGTYFDAGDYIAYCFAEKQGFSKFGSYIGNGNADGPFVYTGFKPAFVITKVSSGSTVQGWLVRDNKRDPFNVSDTMVPANSSSADVNNASSYGVDLLSNGFKIRGTDGGVNQNGGTLIYMAFAEQPLVGDNPATAR